MGSSRPEEPVGANYKQLKNPAGPHQEVPMDLLWPLLGFCQKRNNNKNTKNNKQQNTKNNKKQNNKNNKKQNNTTKQQNVWRWGRSRFWPPCNATQRFHRFFFGFGIKVTASPSWRDPTWSGRGFSLPGLVFVDENTKGGRNTSRSEVMWNGDF